MTSTLRSRAPDRSRNVWPTAGVQPDILPSTITSPREGPAGVADSECHSMAAACRTLASRLPRARSGLGPRDHRAGEPGIPARLGCHGVPRDWTHADHPAVLDRDPISARAARIQSLRRDADALGHARANRGKPAPGTRGLQL